MPIPAGTHKLGPDRGRLTVRTKKAGAAAAAGHNLLIEVGRWEATVEVGPDGALGPIELTADPGSLRVVEASGGITSLGDEDRTGIDKTIDAEVLKGTPISFRCPAAGADGELELNGRRRPLAFELSAADGHITGRATVKQSDWGMKPYSALFGTLKVVDEVVVEVDAQLGS